MHVQRLSSRSRCTPRLSLSRADVLPELLDVSANGLKCGLWRHAQHGANRFLCRKKGDATLQLSHVGIRCVAAFCGTAAEASSSVSSPAGGPTVDELPRTTEPRADATAVDAIFTSSYGTKWRIRPYDNSDYTAIIDVQADSFHNTNPVPILNKLTYNNFRAEVVDALRQKIKYAYPNRFQLLVAHSPSAETANPASAESQADAVAAAADDDDANVVSTSNSSGASHEDADVAPRARGSREPVGSVELSLMGDSEVLRALPHSADEYAYISSMCVRVCMRRLGVAQALMAAAEAQARRWRQPRLALHVYKDNVPAVELYRRCGMRVIGEDPAWKAMLGGRVRLLMYKEISLQDGSEGEE